MAVSSSEVRKQYTDWVYKITTAIEEKIDVHLNKYTGLEFVVQLRIAADKERLETVVEGRICNLSDAPDDFFWCKDRVQAICTELVARYRAAGWAISLSDEDWTGKITLSSESSEVKS
jgi:hypothetical protein